MFIEKITICNMFAYYGKVEVEFKKQERRNLYCIYGDNGFGKTSFIRCAKILFLGVGLNNETIIPAIKQFAPNNLSVKQFIKGDNANWSGILNNDAYKREGELKWANNIYGRYDIEPPKGEEFYIEFSGILDDENFCIKRSFKNVTDKTSDMREILEFQLGKEFFKDEKAQEMLDKIIPPNLNEVFFFDGEQIENISNNLRTEFRDKIEEILGIKYLESIINEILKYARSLRDSENKNKEEAHQLKQLRNEKESIEEDIEFKNGQFKKCEEEIMGYEEQIKNIEGEIFKLGYDSSEEKNALFREKDEFKRNLNDCKDKFKENIKAVIFANNEELIQKLRKELEFLETNQSKDDIQSYKKLLPELKKIANEKIKRHKIDEKYATIFESILESLPEKLEAKNFKDSFINFAMLAPLRESLARWERSVLASDIRQIKMTLAMLKVNEDKISELDDDDYAQERRSELESNKKNIEDLKSQRETKRKELQKERDDLKRQKEQIQEQIDELEQNINTERIDDKLKILESVQDSLRQYKERLIEILRNELKDSILQNYQKLIKDDNVRGLEIDDDFSIKLKDENDEFVVIESQSSGQKQILAIAIFWALSKLAKSNLPLIIDTPLARIDSENRANIIQNYYANTSKQVIILPTDTEIGLKEYEYAQKYIAGLYKIDNQSNRRHATIKTANIDEIL